MGKAVERIKVEQLGKQYARYNSMSGSPVIREALVQIGRSLMGRKTVQDSDECFWAVRDVSFSVREGDAVAVLGRNGAGKTTLLRLLTEVTEPTQGRIQLHGRVGYLLGAATGFHEELTGRENLLLVSAMMGFDRVSVRKAFDAIVDFSEVGSFLDTPVKHYSSGMQMKLGFSLAVHLLPDILILDEILSVGDLAFQQKAISRVREVATQQRTMLFVSHNLDAVSSVCNRALVLEGGRCLFFGDVEEGIRRYTDLLENTRTLDFQDRSKRRGRGEIRVVGVGLESEAGGCLHPLGNARLWVDIELGGERTLSSLAVSVDVTTVSGHPLCTLGKQMQEDLRPWQGKTARLCCDLPQFPLSPGIYELNIRIDACQDLQDLAEGALRFRVVSEEKTSAAPVGELGRVIPAQQWCIQESDQPPSTGRIR